MCKSGGDGGAAAARAAEEARQGRIREGLNKINTTFNNTFNPDFYSDREQSYMDYATPQLEDQYDQAVKGLTLALARSGRLQSSTRGEKFADLQKEYDLARTNIADRARGYSNQARSSVEAARSDLVSQNSALANPSAIATQAINRADALSAKPTFEPLGAFFQNVTQGLATQADLERRGLSRYNTGLFLPAGASDSGRVVGN